jgi:uncharacterized protein YjbI with pentapeptide repeats
MAKRNTLKTALSKNVQAEEVKKAGLGITTSELRAMTTNINEKLNPPKWNTSFTGMDLSNKSIVDVMGGRNVITHYDFSGCNLSGALFGSNDPETGVYKGMTLQSCKFDGADLTDATFAYCDVRWSSFANAKGWDSAIKYDTLEDGTILAGSVVNDFGCTGLEA